MGSEVFFQAPPQPEYRPGLNVRASGPSISMIECPLAKLYEIDGGKLVTVKKKT